ncbi:hypothetical protein AQZ49_02470 [Novosphingobium sp. FSW06-99]|nr:hypothetical protein AQZ49_02470 [Novosphingobium sp. FSW06-99]
MGLQAFGTIGQGVAGMQAADYNASIARQNAAIATQTGLTQIQNSDMQFRQAEGKQIAAAGASGVWGTTGSPLEALAQSRLEQTYSAMNIMRASQVRAAGFDEEAQMDQQSGLMKMLAGITGATSGLMKTQTDYANANNQYGYNPLSPGGAVQPFAPDESLYPSVAQVMG